MDYNDLKKLIKMMQNYVLKLSYLEYNISLII